MNVEIGGHVALDLVEELAELHRAVPGHAFADDGSGLHDQRTSPGECMNLQFLIRMRRLFALVGLVASDKNGKAIVEPPQVRCWHQPADRRCPLLRRSWGKADGSNTSDPSVRIYEYTA
jgi:hypothetical protein